MHCLLKKRYRFFSVLTLLMIMEIAVSAVNVNLTPVHQILLTPGVDQVRETVANIIVNADQPYTIALSGNSNSKLVNTYHSIPYRISYNNGFEISLSANPTVVESGGAISNGNRTLAISVRGSDTAIAAAGNYTATITLTITGF